MYTALAKRHRTIPAGSCPTVGIAGLTLGGGHGVVSRAYGLTCDNLTAATLVTADGRRLHCSGRRHPDLFWALRGAGCGQFGVVTELRFTTHAAPDVVMGSLSWPWHRAADVVAAWQQWGPAQPDEIWSALHLDARPGETPRVSVSLLALTTRDDLAKAVDRLTVPAASATLTSCAYLDAMTAYAGAAASAGHEPPRATYTARSDFYDRSLPPAGITALLAGVERARQAKSLNGTGSGSISLTALGGAVNRVKPDATAFVHRRSRFLAQYEADWPAGTSGAGHTAWLDALHSAMRRYASGAAYQNYTDPALKDWRAAYYGAAAPRLAQLKRRYDPGRLFDFPQAL